MPLEPWAHQLLSGGTEAAWDLFLERYRRLIFATIRHVVRDPDDVMDVFARVLEALREGDFRRLRAYLAAPEHPARFSTWLVTVVRRLAIDWLRSHRGRQAIPVAVGALPPLHQRIFELVLVRRRGHAEGYEVLRTGPFPALTFREYLVALRAVYRAAGRGPRRAAGHDLPTAVEPEAPSRLEAEAEAARAWALRQVLAGLSPEDRVLLDLYVVQGVSADAVAKMAGLAGSKAVYNRVYRLLAGLREHLDDNGVRPGGS